jgi:hypothetical protein
MTQRRDQRQKELDQRKAESDKLWEEAQAQHDQMRSNLPQPGAPMSPPSPPQPPSPPTSFEPPQPPAPPFSNAPQDGRSYGYRRFRPGYGYGGYLPPPASPPPAYATPGWGYPGYQPPPTGTETPARQVE